MYTQLACNCQHQHYLASQKHCSRLPPVTRLRSRGRQSFLCQNSLSHAPLSTSSKKPGAHTQHQFQVKRFHPSIQCAASSADTPETVPKWEATLVSISTYITSMFSVWTVIAAAIAVTFPAAFTWFPTKYITYGLALAMLGMGFTLKPVEITGVITKMPHLLLLGLTLQYTVMPALGYLFSRYAGLPTALAAGMVVVSCCPGGTASNVIAFIAGGEMPLSIMMTAASTLAAVVATPLLTAKLLGTLVPVDPWGLLTSTTQVVLAPVLLGAAANQAFPKTVQRIARIAPGISTLLIMLIVGTTLGHSAAGARAAGWKLLAAVAGLHSAGFLLGYLVAVALKLDYKMCKTYSIEVGMQNATLGAVLATLHFSDPLVAAPCGVSSCVQCIIGSLLAGYWRARDSRAAQAAA